MLFRPSLEGVVVRLNHSVSEDALLGIDCVQVLLVQGGQARLNLGDAALSEAGLDAILYLLEDLQVLRSGSEWARQDAVPPDAMVYWHAGRLTPPMICSPMRIAGKGQDRLSGTPDSGQADRLTAASCCAVSIHAGGFQSTMQEGRYVQWC